MGKKKTNSNQSFINSHQSSIPLGDLHVSVICSVVPWHFVLKPTNAANVTPPAAASFLHFWSSGYLHTYSSVQLHTKDWRLAKKLLPLPGAFSTKVQDFLIQFSHEMPTTFACYSNVKEIKLQCQANKNAKPIKYIIDVLIEAYENNFNPLSWSLKFPQRFAIASEFYQKQENHQQAFYSIQIQLYWQSSLLSIPCTLLTEIKSEYYQHLHHTGWHDLWLWWGDKTFKNDLNFCCL